jgi:thiol-disulfide isomerase/thioredoxin
MQGCPACEEYKPRFRRIYAQLQQQGFCLPPLEFVDVNQPSAQAVANHYDVKYTPTTVLQKANGHWFKWESPLSDDEIRWVLDRASRGAHCEI